MIELIIENDLSRKMQGSQKRLLILPFEKKAPAEGSKFGMYQDIGEDKLVLIGIAVCLKVKTIIINKEKQIIIDGVIQNSTELEMMAKTDGFEAEGEISAGQLFEKYYTEKQPLPFKGTVIYWKK